MSEEQQEYLDELPALMSLWEVQSVTNLKKSKIYCGMRAGTFPVAVRRGKYFTAWRGIDIQIWIDAQARPSATQKRIWLAPQGENVAGR